jgi:signal transduction histidine kinase
MNIVFFDAIIVLIFCFFVSVAVVWIYNKKSKKLLKEIDVAAKLFVRKDREFTSINLELNDRNTELNEIAKILVKRDLELSRSNERLMELDELKSNFVSTAAHQLRTPLTAVKWLLIELAGGESGKLKKEQQKTIEDTIAATNRLISLVNDLLDISRLEKGGEEFDIKKQDIIPVLQEIHSRFMKMADEKGIKFSLEIPLHRAILLTFDKEKIIIALSNLLDNAIKYTLPGGKVSLKMALKEKEVILDIFDTGIGIPQDQISRVFSRFFRASNAVHLETSGSGLGLSVAKDIIEKHNGVISFSSEKNKGSVFSITLPYNKI